MQQILVIDKEEQIGWLICEKVKKLGISPVYIDDFDKALGTLATESFGLVIFEPFVSSSCEKRDAEEERFKAIDVLNEIIQRLRKIPVIVYSAYGPLRLKDFGIRRNKNVFLLTKSADLSELLVKICELLHIDKQAIQGIQPIFWRVLLVVQEENLGKLYKEELEFLFMYQIAVTLTRGYDEALFLLSSGKYDLVIFDADYFDEEGHRDLNKTRNALAKVRQKYENIPMIVISVRPPRHLDLEVNTDNFVLKSDDLTRLKMKVCNVFGIGKKIILNETIGDKGSVLKSGVKIFICYATEDYHKVHAIYVRLKNEKYSPWMDRENLVGGQDWELEIAKTIDGCNFFLACLSKHSVNKEGYVQKELKKGLEIYDRHPEGSIFLIPVRLDDCKVPERFKKFQWVDIFEPDGLADLLKAVETGCKQRGILGSASQ